METLITLLILAVATVFYLDYMDTKNYRKYYQELLKIEKILDENYRKTIIKQEAEIEEYKKTVNKLKYSLEKEEMKQIIKANEKKENKIEQITKQRKVTVDRNNNYGYRFK